MTDGYGGMRNMIVIDGAQGEGGGQVLRSALALSLVTGLPFRIDRVRAGRKRPGLMRQHLTAIDAARRIGNATVAGDSIGSSSVTFTPGAVVPGDHAFAVGTAGSATLVLQTVLPPLMIADAPSRIVLEGGTHNPWAPPFEFLAHAFLPLVNRLGPTITVTLERHGFAPAGGGRFVVDILPARRLEPLVCTDRGGIVRHGGRILTANLPRHVADRERDALLRLTGWGEGLLRIDEVGSTGPGNLVLLTVESEHVTEVFTGFGEQGVRAEQVSRRVVDALRRYLAAGVPVGPHLADQLILPLAIAAAHQPAKPSIFRTLPLTQHTLTHIAVVQAFLGVPIAVVSKPDATVDVRVAGASETAGHGDAGGIARA
jgi:RNA 3'-terminal phosphate cyclase (ATP)